MKKARVMDEGASNWTETISKDDSFNLYVDGRRVAWFVLTDEGIILVSTIHQIELIPFLTDERKGV